jgi:serine/threonine protein kinase
VTRKGSSGTDPFDDPEIARLLREYEADLAAGRVPDRAALLARRADVADALAACLDGLELVHAAAPALRGDAEAPAPHPDLLGDFRIVREIARGGMGVVYEAEQVKLGRRVAVKVLPASAATDAQQLLRFRNEAEAAAQLHHSHIVPVYAVGCEQGLHYFAMQLIEGLTLAGVIDELRALAAGSRGRRAGTPAATQALDAIARQRVCASAEYCRAVARLGAQAAEALEYAHSRGVVHRDVKPANLLIDRRGDVWISDFGLASSQRPAARLTITGDLLGTVRYMSPELTLARRAPVDHRTDVFSLGVSMYEALTLERAFRGEDPGGVIRAIRVEEPPPSPERNPAVPSDLDWIVRKAMAKNPGARYSTAQAMADDLLRHLRGQPVLGRPPDGASVSWTV